MAVNQLKAQLVYDVGENIIQVPPLPIIADRDPAINDRAILGAFWINRVASSVWCLTKITNGQSTWTTSPASGVGVFTSLVVNPGNITVNAGDVDILAGDLSVQTGNVDIAGDLTVNGTTTLSGPIDFASTGLIQITSTFNGSPSILFLADGGINEQIYLHSIQGNNTNAIFLDADAGGITATAFTSMTLTATGGAGLDSNITNTNGSINITAGENIADAIVIRSSGAAAGLQLRCGGTMAIATDATTPTINVANIAPTVNRTTTVNGGTVVTAAVTDTLNLGTGGATTNANSIKTVNLATGGVTLGQNILNIATGNRTSGTHTINVSTGTGTKTVNCGNADAGTTVNIDAVTLINDSINANTSINTGTSTGVIAMGNALAGNIGMVSGGNITTSGITLLNNSANFDTSINTGTSTGDVLIGNALAGDITLVSGGNISTDGITLLNDSTAFDTNINTGTATGDVLIGNILAGDITLTSASAISLLGVDTVIDSGGSVSMAPVADTVASPTATSAINARVFKATFTGFTTAAAASQNFTITNPEFIAGAGVFVTVSNAGTNDAQMTLQRVNTQTSGTLIINTTNNGAAALNGNVVITGWIID